MQKPDLNLWRDPERDTSAGSNRAAAEQTRKALPELLKRYAIKTAPDVPCGDF